MLSPNYYLYGVQMVKNRTVPVIMLGPANIHFDGNTTFVIHIPSKLYSIIKLSSRHVFLYVQNTLNHNDIKYNDPTSTETTVPWNNLEVALVKPVNFTKLQDNKSESIESFLKGVNNTIPHNNNTVRNNLTNNLVNIANSMNQQPTSVPKAEKLEFDWNNNRSFNNETKPTGTSVPFRPSFKNRNTNMNTIIEEDPIQVFRSNSDNKVVLL